MSDNKNKNVVIAFFDNDDWSRLATNRLQEWDRENPDVKLGAIGSLKNEGGKVKTHIPHKTGKGAATGAVLAVIAGVLTGGVGLVAAAAAGGAVGGIAGAFFKKSINLTKEDIQKIGQELEHGRVALVVTCDDHEVEGVQTVMKNSGGDVQHYVVPAEALDEAAEAANLANSPEDI